MNEVSVMELIVSHQRRRGSGKDENSPIRIVAQVFTKEGELVAENDPCGNYTMEDMISFAQYFADPSNTKHTDISLDIKEWMHNK